MRKLLPISIALVYMLLGVHQIARAQHLGWNYGAHIGFVFRISNREAQTLLTKPRTDSIMLKLLHTQVDTFDVTRGWTRRPDRGHFIIARIIENELHCEYTGILPYQVFLLKEYNALALQVVDRNGNLRKDARVKLKHRRIAIDPETETYRIPDEAFFGDRRLVSVELDGFQSFFEVTRQGPPSWYPSRYNDEGPTFFSYMITDKNRYKPGETVRFKSYALSHTRNPLQKTLQVWLTGNKNVKVGTVTPHRPGSYAGSFVLHDSLKLLLDKTYGLAIRDPRGRTVAQCRFNYEDYELNGDHLDIDLRAMQQFYPAANQLTVKATDANGLPIAGGRVRVTVHPEMVLETFQPVLYVPDTLLYLERELNPSGEIAIDIPAGIFDASNMNYRVDVTLVNHTQQQLQDSRIATFNFRQYAILAHLQSDSIVYEARYNGAAIPGATAEMTYSGIPQSKSVILPYKEKVNPNVRFVDVKCSTVSRRIDMSSLLPWLEIRGGFERDSFNVALVNPNKVEASWFIYRGAELLEKGFGREILHRSLITDRSQSYYVEVLYAYAGVDRIKQREFGFNDKQLDVTLAFPERVYPGQTVDATILVKNQAGHPIGGVDITALGVTRKLNYNPADLPNYGTQSSRRSAPAHFDKREVNTRSATLRLPYGSWKTRAGLDTMKYYQLLYPSRHGFSYSTPIADSTQFAIYVTEHGAAKKVYVIEVNRMPVYYSWSTAPHRYSFYVTPTEKTEVTVRLWDRVIIFDSLRFARNRKTIMSVDLNNLPVGVHEVILFHPSRRALKRGDYPAFTPVEQDRYVKYIAGFKDLVSFTALSGGSQFTPLTNSPGTGQVTAGPILPGYRTLVESAKSLTFRFQGGGVYNFEDNVVYFERSKDLLPKRLSDAVSAPSLSLMGLAITQNEFQQREATASPWITRRIDVADHNTQLRINLPEDEKLTGVYAVLFQDPQTGKVISGCARGRVSGDLYLLPRGRRHLIVLYNDGSYVKMDNIVFQSRQQVWVDFTGDCLHEADSASAVWKIQAIGNCLSGMPSKIMSFSQPRTRRAGYGANVQGTVYDDTGEALPGVNVIIKGTTFGTVTDADGNFSLDLYGPYGAIVFSFVGMKTMEMEVRAAAAITVQMETDIQELQEVVVVGYGTQQRNSLLAYAASSVLAGSVAGVQIDQINETSLSPAEDDPTEEAERQLYEELLSIKTLRANFNDVAFWEPKLFTDRKGMATFRVTFPDDITRWDALVYAMNRRLQTGVARTSIRSFKPIMAQLDVPRFMVRGDSAFAHGNLGNYGRDPVIEGAIRWTAPGLSFDSAVRFEKHLYQRLPISAPNVDSLETRFAFTRNDGYLDGETRTIPIFEPGTLRADGKVSLFTNGDKVTISGRPAQHTTVELVGSALDLCAGEAQYLIDYKYACNEQLASKLLGLLAFRNVKVFEQKKFSYDGDVNKIIQRLLKNQNTEFLWSWWEVSSGTSYWVSAHILRALKAAKDAGYVVDLHVANLTSKAAYKFDMLKTFDYQDADLLQALALWNVPLDYSSYVARVDTLVQRQERWMKARHPRYHFSLLREKLLLMEVKQLTGLGYSQDTLLHYRREGIRGEVYFADNHHHSGWYSDDLATNAIAYRIVRRDSSLRPLTVGMQMYFLSERSKGQWNTYQSANLLLSVLPDLISMGASRKNRYHIVADGKFRGTIDQLPYKTALLPNEQLSLSKEGGLPVYLMQYTTERVTNATQGGDGFEITSRLGDGSRLLEMGKPVSMLVNVKAKKNAQAEYVMIEVPIPAACSYTDKTAGHWNETHREYFKDRVNIYFERMDAGSYQFEIELLPRFSGKFQVNPAQVSLMYVPVINANTALYSVQVKE